MHWTFFFITDAYLSNNICLKYTYFVDNGIMSYSGSLKTETGEYTRLGSAGYSAKDEYTRPTLNTTGFWIITFFLPQT